MRRLNGSVVLGIGWVLLLGACSGSDLPVGENGAGSAGMNATSGSGGSAVGTGGSTVGSGGSAVGSGGSAVGSGGSTGGSGGSAGSVGSPDPGGGGSYSTTTTHYFSMLRTLDEVLPSARCMPRPLLEDAAAQPDARLYQVMTDDCSCDRPGYGPAPEAAVSASVQYLREVGYCDAAGESCSDYCFCELMPAQGDPLDACLNDLTDPDGAPGWCYLSEDPPVGNADLLAACPSTQRQIIRLYGLPDETTLLLAAAIRHSIETTSARGDAPLGAPCLPEAERDPKYNGFAFTEVSVSQPAPGCASGVCLLNHFQGRVSCPYGHLSDQPDATPVCLLPGTEEPVTVPVDSQRMQRLAESAAVCSRTCQGPDDCPTGMECARVFQGGGVGEYPCQDEDGSTTTCAPDELYCIPAGTGFDPQALFAPETCVSVAESSKTDPYPCGDPHPY